MGLSINYDLRLPLSVSAAEVRARLEKWREFATTLGLEPRTAVDEVAGDELFMTGYVFEHDEAQDATIGHPVPVEEGFVFWAQPPGSGCETLRIALCRYPSSIETKRGTRETKLDGAWRYQSSCKTQYASLEGWEAFLAAHRAVIDCLAHGRELGVEVQINDEGAYWPDRDTKTLRAKLDEMNGICASMAGALKDAGDDAGEGGNLVAPILDHPDFERLEHEGAKRTQGAAEIVKREVDRLKKKP